MENKNEIYKTLGMNKKDITVYEFLKTSDASGLRVADIVKKTKFPRMTVHITLLSYLKRNLIIKQKVGKQKYYSINENNIIERQNLKINEVNELKVYKGAVGINKMLDVFSNLRNVNWDGYQSKKGAHKILEATGLEKIMKINKSIQENKHVGHAYIESGYLDYFQKHMSKSEFDRWTKSMERTATVREIAPQDFYTDSDLIVLYNKTYLANFEKKIVIEIKQKEIADLLRNFLHLLKNFAHPTNYYEWVKNKKHANL